jgi:hypothetical protein
MIRDQKQRLLTPTGRSPITPLFLKRLNELHLPKSDQGLTQSKREEIDREQALQSFTHSFSRETSTLSDHQRLHTEGGSRPSYERQVRRKLSQRCHLESSLFPVPSRPARPSEPEQKGGTAGMNYAELKKQIKILLVDETQAGAMCGKVTVFHELCAKYGIKPVVKRQSVKLYSVNQIETAVARLELDQLKA